MPLPALTVTADPADVREAARRWRGRNRYGITLRPAQLCVGCAYVLLGIVALAFWRPGQAVSMFTITSVTFVMLGAVSALQGIGQLDFFPRPIPLAKLSIDDAALTVFDERGSSQTMPWQMVKSVERTGDALVFVLTWRRAIVLPVAAVGDRLDELWSQLYAHLVSRRGLNPTQPERVHEIINTALT